MFTTPICQDIYNALLSLLKGTGKLFLLVRKGQFAAIDLRAENELAEQLTQEGHETCELPEFLNRADGTPAAFSLNVDIVTAISKYGYNRARIHKVPVREIMEEDWFSTYFTTTTAFRDVQVARALGLRYPRQPIDYIILCEDPLWGALDPHRWQS